METYRCRWASGGNDMQAYHDLEWGVPVHDDARLFEFLTLEGAQAGLSWATILRKRENYRRAFARFDPAIVAAFGHRDVSRLLADAGIVRNRAKIESAIANARRVIELEETHGSFDAYVWQFVEGKTIQNARKSPREIPAKTRESEQMSRDMRKLGFRFVGPTVCYAFMQAVGMVNDHEVKCFRHAELT
jgi:DNA-3-methyladenine glycosylase I